MARGSTAPLRRGAEATSQDACGPRRRRTQEAHGARQMAERPRATWAPVWGATCRGAERHVRIVNRGILSPIYAQLFPSFNPCGTMFPHVSVLQVTWTRGECPIFSRTATIAWTRVHAIIKCSTCVLLTLSDPLDA